MTAQNITNFRRFSTEQQKSKYIDLLSKEPKVINKEPKVINNEENIASRAYKLYLRKQKFPQGSC